MTTEFKDPQPFNLLNHLARQRMFSERTFGPGKRTKMVADHIRKELIEIEKNPSDITEWVDVILLGLDGAWRSGATPAEIVEAIDAKQAKNEGRIWPDWRTMDPERAIEHDRSRDTAPLTRDAATVPSKETVARLFNKHGGPVPDEGWCLNEGGLNDFLHELFSAAPASPATTPTIGKPLTVNLSQAQQLVELFGGDGEIEIALQLGDKGHSGAGLYALFDEHPEEGAMFLDAAQPFADDSAAQTRAAHDVLAERQRQVSAEGWTPAHDDKQTSGALAVGAACYALLAAAEGADDLDFEWRQEYRKIVDRIWPYDREWLRPHVPRRMLEKSGAMTIAEIERIDRAASTGDQAEGKAE